MNKLVFITSSLLPFIFFVPRVNADVTNDVYVTTDGGNANSSVNINNSTSNNSTSTYTTGGSTNIHVETNGQGYDYHSDKPGSVNVQSINGKVTVNGQEQTTTPSSSSTPEPSVGASNAAQQIQDHIEAMKKKAASDAAEMKKRNEAIRKAQENFFQKLIDELKNFFHL